MFQWSLVYGAVGVTVTVMCESLVALRLSTTKKHCDWGRGLIVQGPLMPCPWRSGGALKLVQKNIHQQFSSGCQIRLFNSGELDAALVVKSMNFKGHTVVFWEVWWKQTDKCEEVRVKPWWKLHKILTLYVKMKTDESKFWPIMTVNMEYTALKCVKREVRLSRYVPLLLCYTA